MPRLPQGVALKRSQNPPERPKPIAPVPEQVAEPVFPYRGTEDHGVTAHEVAWQDTEAHSQEPWIDAEYVPDEPPEHVIPVRIVQGDEETKHQRTILRTHVAYVAIDDPPALLIGRNDRRRKVYITSGVAAAQDVPFISQVQTSATRLAGYPIVGNNFPEKTFNTQGALYVSIPYNGGTAAGIQVPIWIAEEVDIDVSDI